MIEVGMNLAAVIMFVTIDQPPCQFTFSEFATMTDASIKDTFKHSKPKSCILDPIPTQVVKQSAEALTGPISIIWCICYALEERSYYTIHKKSKQPTIRLLTLHFSRKHWNVFWPLKLWFIASIFQWFENLPPTLFVQKTFFALPFGICLFFGTSFISEQFLKIPSLHRV